MLESIHLVIPTSLTVSGLIGKPLSYDAFVVLPRSKFLDSVLKCGNAWMCFLSVLLPLQCCTEHGAGSSANKALTPKCIPEMSAEAGTSARVTMVIPVI